MITQSRHGFTLLDLLLTAVIVATLLLLAMTTVHWSRQEQHLNECRGRLRDIAVACANFESATRRFPLTYNSHHSRPQPGEITELTPFHDADDATGDAYSWLVPLLPYFENEEENEEDSVELYLQLMQTSQKFETRPWQKPETMVMPETRIHFSTVRLPMCLCPSSAAGTVQNVERPPKLPGGNLPAISNYMALSATNLPANAGDYKPRNGAWENGVLVSRRADGDDGKFRGMQIKHISDGISRTMIACESREETYAAWYSASCTWLTATSPETGSVTRLHGFIAPDNGKGKEFKLGLNYGSDKEPIRHYYRAGQWSTAARVWGPSSRHAGGVVMHTFADSRTIPVASDVDPIVYLQAVTRSDGDVVLPIE